MGNDFTLQQLRCFISVAEEVNFRKAAERLHMTQPPLSRQISALERNVGTPLFVRSTRNVQLTSAGRVFVRSARRMLALAERSSRDALEAAAAQSYTINFGFLESTALDLLPKVIPQINLEFPNINLVLREIHTAEQVRKLATRELDIGIMRPPINEDGLEVRPLRSDRLVAVLPKEHKLTSNPLKVSELADESFAHYSSASGESIQNAARLTCMTAGFSPRITHEVTSTPALMSAIASLGCVTLLPAPFADTQQIGVRFVELAEPSVESPVAIVWRVGEGTEVYLRIYAIMLSLSNEHGEDIHYSI